MKVHYDPCWYITLIAGGNHAFLAIRKSSDFMLRFNTTEGIRCSSSSSACVKSETIVTPYGTFQGSLSGRELQ